MNATLIIAALRALAEIVPTVVDGNGAAKAAVLLRLIATLGERGIEGESELVALTNRLQAMHGVSKDEMAALLAEIDDLHAQIQAVDMGS